MRDSIGSVFLYNIIILFIVIVFAILAGTLTYHKAFKINKSIVNYIEMYEGYNSLALKNIKRDLVSVGYPSRTNGGCVASKNGGTLVKQTGENYDYCVYLFDNDGDSDHYSYGVVTYITFDFPFFDMFLKIPVYAKSNKLYKF